MESTFSWAIAGKKYGYTGIDGFSLANTLYVTNRFYYENSGSGAELYIYRDGWWQRVSEDVLNLLVKDVIFTHPAKGELVRYYKPNLMKDVKLGLSVLVDSGEPLYTKSNRNIVCFEDKSYDNQLQKIVDHNPDHFCTRQMEGRLSDIGSGELETKIYKIMSKILGDGADTFIEWLGYHLLGYNAHKKAMVLYGKSNTYKSTLTTAIENLVGSKHLTAVTLDAMAAGEGSDKFIYGYFEGSYANIDGDANPSNLKSGSTFKKLTGNDRVSMDRKGMQPYTTLPTTKITVCMNELPSFTNDRSGAFENRLMIVSTTGAVLTNEEYDYYQDFISDQGRLLKLAMFALKQLTANGNFTLGATSIKMMEDWCKTNDALQMFLDKQVKGITPLDCLYERYSDWTRESNYKPMSLGTFLTRLGHYNVILTDDKKVNIL
jgi:putative DNA primase/helicase